MSTFFEMLMMLILMGGLIAFGTYMVPDLMERFGLARFLPAGEGHRAQSSGAESHFHQGSPNPKAKRTTREQVVDTFKDAASAPMPESPEERKKAIKKKIAILVVIAVVYFFSPLDLIPDPVFGPGQIDDLIVMATCGWKVFQERKLLSVL